MPAFSREGSIRDGGRCHGLRQVELANAIALSGWLGQRVPFPCDTARFDRELQKRMDAE